MSEEPNNNDAVSITCWSIEVNGQRHTYALPNDIIGNRKISEISVDEWRSDPRASAMAMLYLLVKDWRESERGVR